MTENTGGAGDGVLEDIRSADDCAGIDTIGVFDDDCGIGAAGGCVVIGGVRVKNGCCDEEDVVDEV